MKNKIAKAGPSPRALTLDWPPILVTLLVGFIAFGLVAAQYAYANDLRGTMAEWFEGLVATHFSYSRNPETQLALSNLSDRVPLLESTGTNWVQRDKFCIPLAAYGRELDQALPPHARVFMAGMLGPTNASSGGYYYFFKNYLFPRDVEISLDGKAVSGKDGFSGITCDSPEILKAHGFDLMITSQMQLIPLTTNGVPRPE